MNMLLDYSYEAYFEHDVEIFEEVFMMRLACQDYYVIEFILLQSFEILR